MILPGGLTSSSPARGRLYEMFEMVYNKGLLSV
jgi:hypothetical protein